MPQTEPSQGAARCLTIDDAGIVMQGSQDVPIDVLFDGRRIFSFWLVRDTVKRGGTVFYAWPPVLRRFLDGSTTIALHDHVSGEALFSEHVQLGSGAGPILVEDAQGNPMGLDKSLRLTRLFQSRSAEHLKPLLDSIASVLSALETAGVRPFLAYGTLLGAVRDGDFIGHDSDADLGYVSAHDHPADAAMESFRLQRALVGLGYTVQRYSGLAFKVVVRESDGSPRGLDVFGGFLRDGQLYLMGEVGHPFRAEWLEPRSEVTLAGRTFPAPAEPGHMLEAMYGPTWKVPDPAYKFETPVTTVRRLNGWFRGMRVGLDARWSKVARGAGEDLSDRGPSSFVQWVREREPDMRTAVDLGCGTGRDALWLARQGVDTWGLDYFSRGFRKADRKAERQGLPVTFEWANLGELRSVLVTGARLSRRPGPRVMLARHVADATDRTGREHLLRLAKMVVRGSGLLYLQVQVVGTPTSRELGIRPVNLDNFLAQVASTGGRVLERHDLDEFEDGTPGVPADSRPTICRLVITWNP
ncbi:methyltransferase domain-containing protein [Nocardioides sp.]|uniref:class I SAM-dependent methyltransferase n=1 Tax=Nocardioides sp. TaxID=35761 RepID=UPI003D14E9A9